MVDYGDWGLLDFRILDIADMTAEGLSSGGGCRRISDTGGDKSYLVATLLYWRYSGNRLVANTPHQRQNPSSLDRDCDLAIGLYSINNKHGNA